MQLSTSLMGRNGCHVALSLGSSRVQFSNCATAKVEPMVDKNL